MKNIFTKRLPLFAATLFFFFGAAQAQLFPTVSGTVTLDSVPVPNFTLFLSPTDTTLNIPGLPQETAEDGTYSYNLIPGVSYTITAYDTFSYKPFSETVTAEGTNNYIVDIALEARPQDAQFAGSVAFQGNAVSTDIYLLKLDDGVDLSDFEQVESYYAPPVVPVRWASYHFMSDDKGAFNGGLLFGKYVIYVPGNDQYLPYWSAFEANGDISAFAINLVEKVSVSGAVANFEGYSSVKVGAFSINAGRPFSAEVNMQDGTYSLDVAPGEYVFQITAYFFVDDEPYTYVAYYDGKSKPSEADHVMVEGDMQGIDFTLPNPDVSPFTVTGMVSSNQSGAAIAGAHVTVVSVNAAQNTMRSYDAVTDEKGMYTINAQTLLAEDSLIAFVNADGFFAEFYDNQTTFLTADKVVFRPNDVITLDFGLDTLDTSNGYRISGTVTDTLGNPIPFGQVTAYTTATNIGVTYVMVDSLGNYSFDAIFPSGSTVYLQCWAGYDYKPQMYDHADTWEDATPIQIDNADVSNANFELKPMPASRLPLGYISGTVVINNNGVNAAEENPYEGVNVYLRDKETNKVKQVDFVDENGSYTLPIETYGSYEIIVSAPGHEDLGQDVDVTQESGLDVTGVEVSLGPTGIENPVDGLMPKTTQLHNAYPNPFNPSTTILVDMAQTEVASLTIYNVAGQKVATLYSGVLPAGKRQFTWHGVDANGHQVASGLYFYQLRTKEMTQTKSIIFLK